MSRLTILVIVLLVCGAEHPRSGRVARAAEQQVPASTSDPVVENVRTAEGLLLALERKDLDAIVLHLAPEVALVLPLAPDGDNAPANVDRYDGRDAVRAALRRNFAAYKRIVFVDPVFTPSADGRVVFVEARGRFDTVHGRPYRNVYLIKLVFDDAGAVTRIDEWANPVTASMTWGFPLGSAAVPRFTAIGLAAAVGVVSGLAVFLLGRTATLRPHPAAPPPSYAAARPGRFGRSAQAPISRLGGRFFMLDPKSGEAP